MHVKEVNWRALVQNALASWFGLGIEPLIDSVFKGRISFRYHQWLWDMVPISFQSNFLPVSIHSSQIPPDFWCRIIHTSHVKWKVMLSSWIQLSSLGVLSLFVHGKWVYQNWFLSLIPLVSQELSSDLSLFSLSSDVSQDRQVKAVSHIRMIMHKMAPLPVTISFGSVNETLHVMSISSLISTLGKCLKIKRTALWLIPCLHVTEKGEGYSVQSWPSYLSLQRHTIPCQSALDRELKPHFYSLQGNHLCIRHPNMQTKDGPPFVAWTG